MFYATGCAFNISNIFETFDTKRLDMTCEDCKELTGDPHKLPLIKKIFRDCMKIVFKDCITYNNTFELPTGSKKSDIHVTRVDGENFKIARLKGAFSEVDILASQFAGNRLTFNMHSNNRDRIKPIHVDKELRNLLIENTNKGVLYC